MPLLEIPVDRESGAGPAGPTARVLVFHDLLGIPRRPRDPRFVKRYANLPAGDERRGWAAYAGRRAPARRYPGPEHTYKIDPRRAGPRCTSKLS